ncbi:MAG: helix-turn-helix domain-containing protein [Oscillospiraceae bacterium]|jgi:transcriptional regulator with XRE-family HTH domain|nr:helix-turn-helix domain-containing protein [Oscillospiraceae bacterium]
MEYPRIRNMREDNDLSQTQIAGIINVAQRTYSGYESGTRNIPVQAVIKLARFYKTSTDYLLGLTDEKGPYPRAMRGHNTNTNIR